MDRTMIRSTPEILQRQHYRLNGRVHHLLCPRGLVPYVNTKSGNFDTWPAQTTNLNHSDISGTLLSKGKCFTFRKDSSHMKASIVRKPRFLEQLEKYLQHELQCLNIKSNNCHELRLQAYSEVFEYLIDGFKTYKPLLSSIKNEYDTSLCQQRQQIQQLDKVKEMLVTVSEQCDQRITRVQEVEHQEMAVLKQDNHILQMRICCFEKKIGDLQHQVSKLLQELQDQYKEYVDERDARKLLIVDINDLRLQHQDYLAMKEGGSDSEAEEDPFVLRMALRKAREDERRSSGRLIEMVACYGDVVPRREFIILEEQFKEADRLNQATQAEFRRMQAEHSALLDVQKQVTEQRDTFYLELETLKRSSTPRPDWDKCSEYLHGDLGKWKELSEGKSSDELVDVMLSNLGSGLLTASSGSVDDFQPKRKDGSRQIMADFLHEYLMGRFALERMVAEWGYNLNDACQRYAEDESVGTFWNILNGDTDEGLFHQQLKYVYDLLTALTEAERSAGVGVRLPCDIFRATLTSRLPGVDDDVLSAIVRAAEIELGEVDIEEVDYRNLFMEDDEGKTGPFLDKIRRWWMEQRDQYVEDVKGHLEGTSHVVVDEMKQALVLADPHIDAATIDRYVRWVFGDKPAMELPTVMQRLAGGNMWRTATKLW